MTSTPIELELVAGGRPRLGEALPELWAFRGTVLAFAERDLRVKYKQAVLGVAWALLQPLAFLAIFTVFFGRVARIGGDGVNYRRVRKSLELHLDDGVVQRQRVVECVA